MLRAAAAADADLARQHKVLEGLQHVRARPATQPARPTAVLLESEKERERRERREREERGGKSGDREETDKRERGERSERGERGGGERETDQCVVSGHVHSLNKQIIQSFVWGATVKRCTCKQSKSPTSLTNSLRASVRSSRGLAGYYIYMYA